MIYLAALGGPVFAGRPVDARGFVDLEGVPESDVQEWLRDGRIQHVPASELLGRISSLEDAVEDLRLRLAKFEKSEAQVKTKAT